MTTICRGVATLNKNNSPFDRGAADTQSNLGFLFYKEAADMYQKHLLPLI